MYIKKELEKKKKGGKNKESHKDSESYFIHKSLGCYLEIHQAPPSSSEESKYGLFVFIFI